MLRNVANILILLVFKYAEVILSISSLFVNILFVL